MIPMIQTLNADPTIAYFGNFQFSPLWWALSLGANLGGNGTLIGSSAVVVATRIGRKKWILNHVQSFFQNRVSIYAFFSSYRNFDTNN